MSTTILPAFAIRALFFFLFAIPFSYSVSTAQTCSISSIRFSNLSSININNTADNTSDDYYTADVTVSFAEAPATGNLRLQQAGAVLDVVTIPVGSLSGGSHTFTATRLKADGAVNQVTAEFTSQITCALSKAAPITRISTIIAGGSPFQDSLWTWNAANYSIINRFGPTMPGFTITGLNGFATHPVTGVVYTILKVSGVSGRVLATINLQTAVCTMIGNLGDNFSSITFAPDGTLYGVTGDGASVSETVYTINTATAVKTLFKTLGNGADGEVILYNPDNSLIYHWSGNGTVVWETFNPALPANPPAGVTFSGTPGGETFGALYLGSGKILVSNISSQFKEWDVNTGVIGAALANTPDDIRGLVRKHCSSVLSADGNTTFCTGGSVTLSVVGGGSDYQWRLNGANIGGANSSSYVATTAGLYNCVFTDACGYTDSFSVGTEVTLTAPPDVNTVFNQVVCNGVLTNAITFTGSIPGTTFNWANDNTSIGLAASGSGNIAAFTATNAGISPVTATITVTPNFSCNGTPKMFTITVNNPQVASTTPGTTCAGVTGIVGAQATGADSIIWYDAATLGNNLGLGNTLTVSNPTATATYYAEPVYYRVLTPSLAQGNGQNGAIFDVKALADITLDAVSWMSQSANSSFSVYYKTGTWAGSEATPGAWTLLGTVANGSVVGLNNLTLTVKPALTAGQTYGFYFVSNGTLSYTNAALVGGLWGSNADLEVYVGSGMSGLFSGGLVTPRGMNGTFRYMKACAGTARTGVTLTVKALPNVTTDPVTTTVCVNANASFTVAGTGAGIINYQWQENSGSGFANIANGPGYSGATSATLTVNAVTQAMSGRKYRCVLTADCSPGDTSGEAEVLTYSTVTVTPVSNQSVCHNTTFTALNFTGPVGGTTYNWTNNNTSIGLGANGTGGIPSFTATNSSASPVTATITVTPSANGCTGTPANFTITVNPTSTPTPSVSIGVSPGNTGCPTTAFTFTATPTGGGATPTYQWYRSGVLIPWASGAVFTPPVGYGLDGHTITCVMTSSQQCPAIAQVTSNPITMTVPALITPSVDILANPGTGPVCVGASVTFTAAPAGGGTAPTYQWKLNGNNVATGPTYTAAGLPVGTHAINVTMTSNYPCPSPATATKTYNLIINPIVTPSVTFSSPQMTNGNICLGANVTFTANPTNGGSAPVYQWWKNNQPVGTNSVSYNAGTGLVTGDVIKVQMTSNAACQSTSFSQSNPVTLTVWPNVTNSVSIVSDKGNSWCQGMPVTFTATSANGGPTPVYEWYKGSTVVGSNSPVYVDNTLVTGDVISCKVLTNLPCATPATATSNTITMTINPVITASVKIGVNPDSTGCEGDPFLFSAYPQNEGTNPTYQWYVNGTLIPGSVQHQYSNNTLVNGDLVSCELISSMTCVFPVMSDAISMELTPSPEPKVQITGVPGGDGIIFYSTVTDAGPGATLQWRKNGVDIQGETGPTYTGIGLQPEDMISLYVHSIVECADPEYVLSNVVEVRKVTSVGQVQDMFEELTLFPNPNSGKFRLKGTLNTTAKEADIEVMNSIGQSVYKGNTKLNSSAIDAEIDMRSRVVPGMYMLRISIDGQLSSLRFVIE